MLLLFLVVLLFMLSFSSVSYIRVWQIDVRTGLLTVLAGTGEPGMAGDGSVLPAEKAQLNTPQGIGIGKMVRQE